jgi:hypothetical protein
MIFRSRFADLVARQLDVFSADEADGILAEVGEAKARYDHSGRDESEEAYGDYMDVVDAAGDALAEMRDRYARTLDPDAAAEYEAAFERAARKRWRWLS